MKKIYDNKKLIILISCIVLLIVFLLSFINKEENDEEEISFNTITKINETTTKEKESFYIDVKGNVKNPGVYEIKENYTIQNVIEDAGGLKKNSYTKNINLSKKVTDEMVIYIFNNTEIETSKKLNKCICTPTYKYIDCNKKEIEDETTTTTTTTTNLTTEILETTKETTSKVFETTKKTITTIIPQDKETTTTTQIESNIININTASLEELVTLKGLGEKKAASIIEYRNTYGLFQTIEDIMKVSGIGESTFEKIKESIKV